jgi:hypothetical protein
MKKAIVGAVLVAVLSAGATYGVTAGETGVDRIDKAAQKTERQHEAPTRPNSPPGEGTDRPGFGPGSAVMKKVEIGMAYGEVLALLGPADWEETQSTDFGDDVILWYGAWAVYVSNETVRTVDYYDGEA